jgi:hypothetical protein
VFGEDAILNVETEKTSCFFLINLNFNFSVSKWTGRSVLIDPVRINHPPPPFCFAPLQALQMTEVIFSIEKKDTSLQD